MISIYENVNKEKLQVILNNKEYVKSQMRASVFESEDEYKFSFSELETYFNKIHDNQIKVSYKQNNDIGRYFVNYGLQRMPREIRGTISEEYYYDLDIVNCHPVILNYICNTKINFSAKYLQKYIDNRDIVVNELLDVNEGSNYDDIKQMILAIINGGLSAYKKVKKTEWLRNFKDEIEEIHDKLYNHYSKKEKYAKKIQNKEFNKKGSLVSILMCEKENKIIQNIADYLKEKKIIKDNYVLCFDGIMIPKNTVEDTEKLILDLKKYSKSIYNLDLNFKVKAMEVIDLSGLEKKESLRFDCEDKYFWVDFRRELNSKVWNDLDELVNFCIANINRVVIKLNNSELYIKNDYDDMYLLVKILPELNIKYNSLDNKNKPIIQTIKLNKLLNDHLVNYLNPYSGFRFKPNDSTINSKFNLWNGFKAQLLEKDKVETSKIDLILNHLKIVWANNDDKLYQYILSWFHNLFKYPERKNKVAMIFQSNEQQIGKSIVLESFIKPYVLGVNLCMIEKGLGFTTERFNSRLMNKILVVCEELSTIDKGYHTSFDGMKMLITNETMPVEIKGGAKFNIENYINFIGFTNNEQSIKVEQSDARYFINKCNPQFRDNFQYFDSLLKTFNEENANHFFSYIYYLDNPVEIRNIPNTQIKKDIKLNSLSSSKRFIYKLKELIENPTDEYEYLNHILDDDKIKPSDLYTNYSRFCERENEKRETLTKFGRDIKDIIEKVKNRGDLVYKLSSITALD